MKRFNKDDFKKKRDQYPMFDRLILAIIIACAIGLALATNDVSFAATNSSPTESTLVRKTEKSSEYKSGMIAPDFLPSGNSIHKSTAKIGMSVKIIGTIFALLAIGVSLFNFKTVKNSTKKD
ncbi:hypothetical protein [Companilactobacillus ginsenosidimutans]|uniref:PDGLE domain-containing protein n=1 Tax=Companilactobacillus ginsenosidimutans TaxID=1007676 RepID=A0A0H4QMX8_9LACO|nr:hypothetical protein [Companilactobacillus ginsenosidimutans]AKP68078.1 hypothetical protein ABM34_11395 [Companilactobacillus ginsenosidimutans]